MKSIFLSLLLIVSTNLLAQEYSKMCYYSAAGLAVGGMTVFTAKQVYDTYNVVSSYEEEQDEVRKNEVNSKNSKTEKQKKGLKSIANNFINIVNECDQALKSKPKKKEYEIYRKIGKDLVYFVIYPFMFAALLGSIGFGLSYCEDRTD